MESIIDEEAEISQEEYTFPNLLSSSECRNYLLVFKAKIKPHKIIFWMTFAAFMIFMLMTMAFGLTESAVEFEGGTWNKTLEKYVYEKADYTGTIISAVLLVISIIVGIVNLVLSSKYSKNINYLTGSIKINAQYSTFINQGFEKKEAYKLTLEWLDRQFNMNSVAATNALIAMSNISHINHH